MFDRNFFESLDFRVMNAADKESFPVNSPVGLIADSSDFLVVVDGVRAEIYGENGEFDIIEDISCL